MDVCACDSLVVGPLFFWRCLIGLVTLDSVSSQKKQFNGRLSTAGRGGSAPARTRKSPEPSSCGHGRRHSQHYYFYTFISPQQSLHWETPPCVDARLHQACGLCVAMPYGCSQLRMHAGQKLTIMHGSAMCRLGSGGGAWQVRSIKVRHSKVCRL